MVPFGAVRTAVGGVSLPTHGRFFEGEFTGLGFPDGAQDLTDMIEAGDVLPFVLELEEEDERDDPLFGGNGNANF